MVAGSCGLCCSAPTHGLRLSERPAKMTVTCMFTTRTLSEGKWPIAILGALSLVMILWCPFRWAAGVPLVLLAFTISFFCDPTRSIPADPNLIVAPADGRIVEIKPVREHHFFNIDTTMVAIFLSIFDVHVQRMPIAGVIKYVD